MDINTTTPGATRNKSKFMKGALIIGIVIVINLFLNYSLSLVYKQPEYQDFCKQTQVVKEITTQKECTDMGGQWNQNTYPQQVDPASPVKIVSTGYCNQDFTCQNNYQTAADTYNRTVFIVLMVAGALLLVGGMFLLMNDVLATALSYAGVLSFLIASIRYWSSADTWVKVLILGLALAVLIGTAMKKFNDK